MSVSFGGVALIAPTDAILDSVNRHLSVADIPTFTAPCWSGLGGRKADYADLVKPCDPGRLRWPTGASRWATGYFLMSSGQRTAINALVKPTLVSATAPVPLTLTIGDGTRTISTTMYALASRPLLQFGTETVWLLTLVDVRYWWWTKTAAIAITAGTTAWSDLVSSIGTALGETLTLSTVDADYLKPHPDLATNFEYLPPLLDAVAYSIGRRVVRSLDGTVSLQAVADATTRRDSLITAALPLTQSGGSFAFGDTGADLWSVAPDTVAFSVRNLDIVTSEALACTSCSEDGEAFTQASATAAGLALAEYAGVGQYAGQKIVRSTAVRWMDGVTQQNDAELQALVDQWATDWYRWRLGDQYRMLGGTIYQWDGDGFADTVEWDAYAVQTRISRGPLNDLADHVYHQTSNTYVDGGAGTCVSQVGCVPTSAIPGYTSSPLQLLGHDENGCLKWVGGT